ncbi:DNA-binding protein [Clostridiales bacterium PH28_bin88]|nr:DNA-binding protein [Clostridiales bacterium PH28_bin88]
MSKTIETVGRTVEEAIQQALKELKANREEIKWEVLEEPSKGLFGLRSRMAKVKVTLEEDPVKLAKSFMNEVFNAMGVSAKTEVHRTDEYIQLSFHGQDLGILIGRRGETLDALQYLVNLSVNKKTQQRVKFILDVEDYRRRREQTLVKLAQRLSEKVKRGGHNVVLEPMNPHERRVIHTALQNDKQVYTYSEGTEPFRKVVISLKK